MTLHREEEERQSSSSQISPRPPWSRRAKSLRTTTTSSGAGSPPCHPARFLTRMSKSRQRVGVDAFQVFGDASKYLTEDNLNITLRTQCDEALKRYPLAYSSSLTRSVAAFVPQNETQESLFK